jgi:uncharacterized membrane protein YfbV (UPF0208 family)
MGFLVSSRYHYIENHPQAQLSYSEMEHELQHLKKREQLSTFVAAASFVLALLMAVGVLGGGNLIIGALFAIATLAALYAYCCRRAETGLRDRQVTWFVNPVQGKLEEGQVARGTSDETSESLLGYFSSK